ncbi:metallothionein [Erythrobacteraceae bacterium CFH 75059]|uniref:metallothionein n=1 Tax=Qipengyuania thermophila TaxID=2509361 RepID=UPI00101F1F7C|nr:metallothionein [Qipengyuania thermophila]TCD02059.1 metallothionein [Erythrobacteraceae bacterium CFH 75059]
MSVAVEMVKCACADCVCVVGASEAIMADGRGFCSDTCASHHQDGAGCAHAGCLCHG